MQVLTAVIPVKINYTHLLLAGTAGFAITSLEKNSPFDKKVSDFLETDNRFSFCRFDEA